MKKSVYLALFLAGTLALSGCEQKAEVSKPTTLMGFSQLGAESAWRLGNTESMKTAAAAHGIDMMVDNANQKQEKQIAAIRSFIAYRVDVIAFSPIVESGWDTVLTEAKNANIPVILVDRHIDSLDDSLYSCLVGADFLQEGVSAGEFLLQKADETGRDQLNVIEITGTLDSTPTVQRQLGFWQTLGDDGRFVRLESVSGDFLRSKGYECMKQVLEKHGNAIDVIYSHNDSMTLGAVQAMEEAGLAPAKDIIIISVDGEQAAIDLLKEGKLNCVVECTPHLGELVMQMAEKLLAGESVPKSTHPIERVFTERDDLTDLPKRGY